MNKLFSNIISEVNVIQFNRDEEIEVKFLLLKSELPANWKLLFKPIVQEIDQNYFDMKYFDQISDEFELFESKDEKFFLKELRVRSKNNKFFITAKGKAGIKEVNNEIIDLTEQTIRKEVEKEISSADFYRLKKLSSSNLKKTRYSFRTQLAGEEVLAEIDDYTEIKNRNVKYDFLICEVEVPDRTLASILLSGNYFIKNLLFLRRGVPTTGISGFSNREIAEFGMPCISFEQAKEYLKSSAFEKIKSLISSRKKDDEYTNENIQIYLGIIDRIENPPTKDDLNVDEIGASQNVLSELRWKKSESLGSEKSTRRLEILDKFGKGWQRDYHTIVTSKPFRRLFLKPQVFRVNEGSTNTTTRGTHTLDVISLAQQICIQLGLNLEYTSAMAALHDIGHPPLGHVGELILTRLKRKDICTSNGLNKRQVEEVLNSFESSFIRPSFIQQELYDNIGSVVFRHNVFSVSLAEIFDMNLLKEVLFGAPLHKTSNKPFRDPEINIFANRKTVEEIVVLRVADKLSYVPRDIFDSIENNYFSAEELPESIMKTLGDDADKWFEKFLDAVVKESAERHAVDFTASSEIEYEAYKTAKKLIYDVLHKRINWNQAKVNLEICYNYNKMCYPDLDPVVITAYMNDEEVNRMANLIEASVVDTIFPESELISRGFGHLDIVTIMKNEGFDPSRVYYSQIPVEKIKNR